MPCSVIPLLLLFLSSTFLSPSSSHPGRYFKSLLSTHNQSGSTEYLEITKPLSLPAPQNPCCSLLVLQQDFANTYGYPPAFALYSPPPNCSSPWSKIILDFSASCQGDQYDRIAGIWVDGVEILRTSTAEPTQAGVFWNVRKDVTRYSSLLQQSNLTLTMMLENIVNDVYTGVYNVNVSLHYYQESPTVPSVLTAPLFEITVNFLQKEGKPDSYIVKNPLSGSQNTEISYEKPADLIIPVSNNNEEDGSWFRIQDEYNVHSKKIQVPLNTYKAVLEVYVSFHGDDEFWYSNPPESYIKLNNLDTQRGNGAFREVFVTMDGLFVGSVVPFPVIFTGGINPLFWEPVVAIGAFDLPSYDIDLTPFLGLILDGKSHLFRIGVRDGIQFWLVDANLHLWLDPNADAVMAKTLVYEDSEVSIERESEFEGLDGSFKIKAQRKFAFSGWVNSSEGNITSYVSNDIKVKNEVKFKNGGQLKEVKQTIKVKRQVKKSTESGGLLKGLKAKIEYPLEILMSSTPGAHNNTYLEMTNVSHARNEKSTLSTPSFGDWQRKVQNRQISGGWMVVKDHDVLSGAANTQQTFSFIDRNSCYSRIVDASNGILLSDSTTLSCLAYS